MLTQLKLQLSPEGVDYFSSQKAVLLQSILMERASLEYSQKMHEMGLHPYSQAVVRENNKSTWIVNALTEEAASELLLPLENFEFQDFKLERDDLNVQIISRVKTQVARKHLLETFYFGKEDRYAKIIFRTPTSFKSDGRYVNYPRIDLLLKSIIQKYEAIPENETLGSDELIEQLNNAIQIVGYKLNSCRYFIGKGVIPAFVGEITIRIDGSQSLINFTHFLLRYGEFSGIGVKTGMGMGNISR